MKRINKIGFIGADFILSGAISLNNMSKVRQQNI